jgi:hypothetical protein
VPFCEFLRTKFSEGFGNNDFAAHRAIANMLFVLKMLLALSLYQSESESKNNRDATFRLQNIFIVVCSEHF